MSEGTEQKNKVECEECDGDKVIEHEECNGDGCDGCDDGEIICPTCQGEGVVDDEEEVKPSGD